MTDLSVCGHEERSDPSLCLQRIFHPNKAVKGQVSDIKPQTTIESKSLHLLYIYHTESYYRFVII